LHAKNIILQKHSVHIPEITPGLIFGQVPAPPRVAFFTDTFHEINGVALTSRQFTAFAQRHHYPFVCVRGREAADESREAADESREAADESREAAGESREAAGESREAAGESREAAGESREAASESHEGSVIHLELKRSPLAFTLDKGLRHDPLLWRHAPRVLKILRDFRPDVIHVVSPGDVSEIGVYVAKRMKLPLAISWHTNLHEFGALRLERALRLEKLIGRSPLIRQTERAILETVLAFYRMGDVLYAPNEELVAMLKLRTGKPVHLMKRGIDTALFTPTRRTVSDGILRLGYVGRITPEKSVRFLHQLETALRAKGVPKGVPDFRFLIVGDGSERDWLRQNLRSADLPGILRGEALATAYANKDVFVFPSETDTFGNVILEAFASGVPAVVTAAGGPKFIVRHGSTGFIAPDHSAFIDSTAELLRNQTLRRQMADAAQSYAAHESWDSVFDKVYEGY
jgi:glycosyltransferase involved in cell wall biosynthesis